MSRSELRGVQFKTFLAVIWFIFTVSMVGWWWIFALRQSAVGEVSAEVLKRHRMFLWEGSFLLTVIALGGGALIFLSYRDQKRHENLQSFFATFSHDIKTSITRLRLQAEVLEEEPGPPSSVLSRLIKDIARLDLQLENSLLLSTADSSRLIKENLKLSKLIESLRVQWPELQIHLDQDAEVRADRRAMTSVLRNLIQNAVLHGQASAVKFSVEQPSSERLEIVVEDDGRGFEGDVTKLGRDFYRSKNDHGSGIGLYLSRLLLQKMHGDLRFTQSERHLKAHLLLEGRRQ